jgi:hypothetical protein
VLWPALDEYCSGTAAKVTAVDLTDFKHENYINTICKFWRLCNALLRLT